MKNIILAAAVALAATSVNAQEFYGGLAFDYGMPHSGDDTTSLSALGGVRFGGGPLQFGGELDYGMNNDSNGPDALRLRGTVHNDMGNFGMFATMGLTQYDASGALFNGFNAGLGGDYGLTDTIDLRVEFIRDWMAGFGTDVTSVRTGVTYHF